MKTNKSISLCLLINLLIFAKVKAQDEIDTLYLFPDTTPFINIERLWTDFITNFAIKLETNENWDAYEVQKILALFIDTSFAQPSFAVSLGEQPEDSVLFISDWIPIPNIYPTWSEFIIIPPVKIENYKNFYISGGILFLTAPSYWFSNDVQNEYAYIEPSQSWDEGWGEYFSIKAVVKRITTDVKDLKNSNTQFYINQNYPNPFNPSTKINYQIGKESLVQLKVYDVLGNEVATLVNEYKDSGSYEVEFNASKLSSGIYFYKLQVGGFVNTKKMILLR